MPYLTYCYRIRDSSDRNFLIRCSQSINRVWNECNHHSYNSINKNNKWLSHYDLAKMMRGVSFKLNIAAQSIQRVCKEYVQKRVQFKKNKLKWRTRKRHLGWIPFTNQAIKYNSKDGSVIYFKRKMKLWHDREIKGIIKSGSFNEDSRGRWYVSLVVEVEAKPPQNNDSIGIDLGCKTKLALSDGTNYSRENITKKHEIKLAKAQRAHKKKLTTKIHSQIKNQRKDWNHKVTREIVNKYSKKCEILQVGS